LAKQRTFYQIKGRPGYKPKTGWKSYGKLINPFDFSFLSFGTVFCCTIETLQMQTARGHKMISATGFSSTFSQSPVSTNQAKRLKIREFMSWSVCFGIVTALTGLIKYLKVGITMDTITTILFFLSLSGLIYFVSRIFLLSKTPVQVDSRGLHELN
jgi:hypothetical protein